MIAFGFGPVTFWSFWSTTVESRFSRRQQESSAAVLKHLEADVRYSDEASLRDALERKRAKGAAKRRAA